MNKCYYCDIPTTEKFCPTCKNWDETCSIAINELMLCLIIITLLFLGSIRERDGFKKIKADIYKVKNYLIECLYQD